MALAWHSKGKPWEAAENYRRGSPLEFVKGATTPTTSRSIEEVIETRGFARKNGDGRNAARRLANRCMGRFRSSPQHFKLSRIDARRSLHRASSNSAAILEKPVSDRGTLEDLSQSGKLRLLRVGKLLILNGEMSEWSIEHARKTILASRIE